MVHDCLYLSTKYYYDLEDLSSTLVLHLIKLNLNHLNLLSLMFNTSQINHLTKFLYFQKAATNSKKSPSSKGFFFPSLFTLLWEWLWELNIVFLFFYFFSFWPEVAACWFEKKDWTGWFFLTWFSESPFLYYLATSALCCSKTPTDLLAIVVGWRIQEKSKKDRGQKSRWIYFLSVSSNGFVVFIIIKEQFNPDFYINLWTICQTALGKIAHPSL